MLVPSAMRACEASTRATAGPPCRGAPAPPDAWRPWRRAPSAARRSERAVAGQRERGRHRAPARRSWRPWATAMPARASSQPASSVSASGTAARSGPASRSTAKPSASSAPAPPRSSGTQASVSPASSSALQAGAFQPSPALLTVCGSARSVRMRRVVSAIGLSLPMARGSLLVVSALGVRTSIGSGPLSRQSPGCIVPVMRTLLSWSTGKDSAWSLLQCCGSGRMSTWSGW